MRILTFNYEYPPLGGGGGVVHQQIAEELAKRHEVAVITSAHRELPLSEVVRGVKVHRVKILRRNSLSTASLLSMLSYYPASLRRGQVVIDEMKPDVINTHFAVPTGPSAVRLARRNRLPHALCIHGGDIFDPSKRLSPHRHFVLRRTVRNVLGRVDRILAQSRDTAENAKRIYGISREIEIIPHGLKVPQFSPLPRAELGLSDDQIVVITVGRLVARKANHELVKVFSEIGDPRVVLVILGEGPERKHIEATAARCGVAEKVIMPGFVSEERKFQYLRAADIFASTTMHEGFGLMFVEGMFCGLPVITYDHGGHSDFLEHEKSGFVVPLNDRRAFLKALRVLCRDGARRAEIARHNEALSRRYTIEACAARYESVFHEMLGYAKATAH